MVDLSVSTNHRMVDMYYNTSFPHSVLSIVTGCFIHCYRFNFLYWLFIFEKSVFTTRLEANAVVKKMACVEPCVCLTTILLNPETRQKKTDIHAFRMFWFSGNRCSHNSGEAGHTAIPEVP